MTNETKNKAQIIFNAINAMYVAYEQIHNDENDELSSFLYSVHVAMESDDMTDAEIIDLCIGCLEMATESFQN